MSDRREKNGRESLRGRRYNFASSVRYESPRQRTLLSTRRRTKDSVIKFIMPSRASAGSSRKARDPAEDEEKRIQRKQLRCASVGILTTALADVAKRRKH